MHQHTVQTPYIVGEVHFYSAEIDGGLVMFDTGPPTPGGEACLLDEVDLKRLKYVCITHCHVDHYGLANFILQQSDAEVFIPRSDAVKFQRHPDRMKQMSEILAGYGFGEDFAAQLQESFDRNKVFPQDPSRFRIVEEAEKLGALGITCLPCPGHSQSDMVYLLGDAAITGDILLRNIFQAPLLDINLETFNGRFRNYDAYCNSLFNLVKLRGRTIMPGHRNFVKNVDGALVFYVRTLLDRAALLLPFRGQTVDRIIEQLFKGRLTDPFFVYLKMSEIVFMLDFLENQTLLKSSLEQVGLFDAVSELYAKVT
ncbi:MAG: MBL fold metallo-hydrolase [Desulfuromonadaceae bacterium]